MIDINKKYRTRDGREVRIYTTDGRAPYSVHGAVLCAGGWVPYAWLPDGAFTSVSRTPTDLIEVKEKHVYEVWVNVHQRKPSSAYTSKEIADSAAGPDRIACLHIVREYEEGEGL